MNKRRKGGSLEACKEVKETERKRKVNQNGNFEKLAILTIWRFLVIFICLGVGTLVGPRVNAAVCPAGGSRVDCVTWNSQ